MKPLPVAIIMLAILASVALLGLQQDSDGGWVLEPTDSTLHFVSTKAKDVGEVHSFTDFSGTVAEDGSVVLDINLASVDTLIPLRDERMRNMLFNVASFPSATLTGQVDVAQIMAIPNGESERVTLALKLDLHGSSADIEADVNIARLDQNHVQVASAKPVIVNAASFGLVEGIERLRNAAGLPGISAAVPVTFVLTYRTK